MSTYYSKNSNEYINKTFNVDMSFIYARFEKYLKPGSKVLDLGFGSGRDSLYFQKKGYEVYSLDNEDKFIKHGKDIGLKHLIYNSLEDFNSTLKFDGIFACASLLHIPSKKLNYVFCNLLSHLSNNGIIYMSFKYGDFEGIRDGRYYTDITEKSFKKIFKVNSCIVKFCKTISFDKTKWLNIFLKLN